jgi:hypothetical protein
MSELNDLVAATCNEGGEDGVTVYATNNGFDLILGAGNGKYVYSIRCIAGGEYVEHNKIPDIASFVDSLVAALYRVFNSEDFDEDDEFEQAWVEATGDDDLEWDHDDIRLWLTYELSE